MEFIRGFSPAITDEFIRTSPLQRLESFAKIVGLQEYLQVLSQLRMVLVKVAIDRLLFDAPVHALDLSIRPRMIGLGQTMFNPMRLANFIELQLAFALRPRLMGKLRAVVGQDGMNLVGHGFDEPAQKSASGLAFRALMQLGEDKLGCSINGDKEIELAFIGAHMTDVQVKVADGICFEAFFLGCFAFGCGQPVDAMALEAAIQAGAGQMRDGLLQGVKAVIQGQQGLFAEGDDNAFLLLGQDSGAGIFGSHRQVMNGVAFFPFVDGLGIDAEALGQLVYALLTILYFSTGRLSRCGAWV